MMLVFLSRSLDQQSDSAALLKILGFEIMLKCSLLASNHKPKKTHDYRKLWLALPDDTRMKIIGSAKSRMYDIKDFSNIDDLLRNFQYVFEKARYYYEFYEGYTLKEQHENGKSWARRGSPLEEAAVRYYPDELECLIYGLSEYIKEKAF
jgi:hypothetical protein